MAVLSGEHRRMLERAVGEARAVAEAGAAAAIKRLGVAEVKVPSYLSPDEADLRVRLRAHARQLRDELTNGIQAVAHLREACAYEHWHRMLFAHFLITNGCLVHPDLQVAMSIEEVHELAKDAGQEPWVFAATCAQRMLPAIFRQDDPVLQVKLPPEATTKLQALIAHLPTEVWKARDSLGWVYQFWQSERKEAVNKAGDKIGADEISAVTQLFTEPYMVDFLLHNTLGAWWAARRLEAEPSLHRCATEAEVRAALSPAGFELSGLRLLRDGDRWRPATDVHTRWPAALKDLTVIDPCCGSGHFLVGAVDVLAHLHRALGAPSMDAAIDLVLGANVHGLELDPRCTQIAAFAVALASWTLPGATPGRALPRLQIACCGERIAAGTDIWSLLTECVPAKERPAMRTGLELLQHLCDDAPILGSLIDPAVSLGRRDAIAAPWDSVRPFLERAVQHTTTTHDADSQATAIRAQGVSLAMHLLAQRYHLVATNVPFLGREKQDPVLKDFCENRYPEAKADLACVMLERCCELAGQHGIAATVSPQYWLFLARYEKFRARILDERAILTVAKLGSGAFETITGEVVNTALTVLAGVPAPTGHRFACVDASAITGAPAKAGHIASGTLAVFDQAGQRKNPNTIIAYEAAEGVDGQRLSDFAYSYQGLATSDNSQFVLGFWELPAIAAGWVRFQMSPGETQLIDGCWPILHWDDGKGRYAEHAKALKSVGRLGGWKSGHEAWGHRGIAVNRMGDLPACLYTGAMFDCNVAVIIPNDPKDLPWIWAYVGSADYALEVRRLNQKACVTNGTLIQVPAQKQRWQAQAPALPAQVTSNDPSQWCFHGHITQSTHPLQVAMARVLGFAWPDGNDPIAPAHIDSDGIVCLGSVRGERPAADRLRDLLADVYGSAWSAAKLQELLSLAGAKGKTLEQWLQSEFFKQHCQVFANRPFIWHIWDGAAEGFNALVNYHRLDHHALATLAHTYLGDWITARRREGKGLLVDAAVALQQQLDAIAIGEQPLDIFVRWKPCAQQPIGWHPELNDGVRVNIRPFIEAGVLRVTPAIKYGIDKGKNPPGPAASDWGDDRDMDRHVALADKQKARAASPAQKTAR